jgi:hypothetical protein
MLPDIYTRIDYYQYSGQSVSLTIFTDSTKNCNYNLPWRLTTTLLFASLHNSTNSIDIFSPIKTKAYLNRKQDRCPTHTHSLGLRHHPTLDPPIARVYLGPSYPGHSTLKNMGWPGYEASPSSPWRDRFNNSTVPYKNLIWSEYCYMRACAK